MMVYAYSRYTVRLTPYSKVSLVECLRARLKEYMPPWHHDARGMEKAVAKYGLEFGWV